MVGPAPPPRPWDQRVAAVLARPLARTPLTPNMITTATLALGLLAALGFATRHNGPAGLAFVVAVFSDHLDGELARRTGRTSRFGHVYDRVVAGIVYVAAFVGIGIGVAAAEHAAWPVLTGLAAGLSVVAIFSLNSLGERQVSEDFADQPSLGGFEVEDVMYLLGPIAWLGLLDGFILLAGIGAPLYLLAVVVRLLRGRRA